MKPPVTGAASRHQGLISSVFWGWWGNTEHPETILSSLSHSTQTSLCMLRRRCLKGHVTQAMSTGRFLLHFDLNALRPGHEKCLVFIHSGDQALI